MNIKDVLVAHRTMSGELDISEFYLLVLQEVLAKGDIHPGDENRNSKWLSFTLADVLIPFKVIVISSNIFWNKRWYGHTHTQTLLCACTNIIHVHTQKTKVSKKVQGGLK